MFTHLPLAAQILPQVLLVRRHDRLDPLELLVVDALVVGLAACAYVVAASVLEDVPVAFHGAQAEGQLK